MTKAVFEEFEQGDELAPNFDVIIEGKDASKANPLFEALRPLIAGVSYEEDEEMAALFELLVINQPDVEMGTGSMIDWRAVLDCKAFQEGNGVDLFMGYAGLKRYMGRVEIVKWLPKGTTQGVGTFTIKGYDGRHKMMAGNQYKAKKPKEERAAKGKTGKKKKRAPRGAGKKKGKKGQAQQQRHVFRNMTDDQIVKKIAAKYGYAADCDTPEKSDALLYRERRLRALRRAGFKDEAAYEKYKNDLKMKGAAAPKPSTAIMPQPGQTITGGGKGVEGKSKRRTSALPSRVQTSDQTDWQFLQRLAKINRFDLWVDYDLEQKQWCVHFKKRKDVGEPEFTFTYNGEDGSLIEWEAEFAITEQSTSVEVLYFDRNKRQVELTKIEETQKAEDVNFGTSSPGSFTAKKTLAQGARVRFTAFGQTLEAVADKPFRSRTDAEKFIKDWLSERERDFMILKGKVIGVETLKPRQVHEFVGMSNRCDGVYRLTQVKHAMQPGQPYVVDFVAHKVLSQEVSRRKPTSKANVKVAGKKVISGGGKVIGQG